MISRGDFKREQLNYFKNILKEEKKNDELFLYFVENTFLHTSVLFLIIISEDKKAVLRALLLSLFKCFYEFFYAVERLGDMLYGISVRYSCKALSAFAKCSSGNYRAFIIVQKSFAKFLA